MKYIIFILLLISNIGLGQSKTISVIVSDTVHLKPIEYIYLIQAQVDYSEMPNNGQSLSDQQIEELYKKGYSNIISFLYETDYVYEENILGDVPSKTEKYNSEIKVHIPANEKLQFASKFGKIEYAYAFLSRTEYEEENRHHKSLINTLLSKAKVKAKEVARALEVELNEFIEYEELVNETEEKILGMFSALISTNSPFQSIVWRHEDGVLESSISVKYSVK